MSTIRLPFAFFPTQATLLTFGKCELCELVLETGAQVAGKEESEIVTFLDNVCKFLPSIVRHECDAFVSANFDKLVQYMKNGENDEKMCFELKACPDTKNVRSQ